MNINIKKNLVFAHKIIAYLKMDDLTYTHISVKNPDFQKNNAKFFISPFGKCYDDTEEDDILDVIDEKNIIQKNREFNPTGLMIHGSIYESRKDINAIIHLHTSASIAVSSLKSGLWPISQHAFHFYEHISYHDYDSLILSEEDQSKALIKDLGDINYVMFLRNHGFITSGKTLHQALFYAYHLEKACQIQLSLMAVKNKEELVFPSHNICQKAYNDLNFFEKDLGLRDWNAWKIKLKFQE